MGNLNGNGNGNTLLNIDFYDYEGDSEKADTEAHISSANPELNILGQYAGSLMEMFSGFFS